MANDTFLIRCPGCQATTGMMKVVGPHTGLYCAKCGRWIKWVRKASNEGKVKIWPKPFSN